MEEAVVFPKNQPRIRCRIFRYKDEHGVEQEDRSTRHAVITVWPKWNPHFWPPVQIEFDLGEASGDFYIKDVTRERRQWILRWNIVTTQYTAYYPDGKLGDHEWWAARSLAIRVIETARRHEATKIKKYGGLQPRLI